MTCGVVTPTQHTPLFLMPPPASSLTSHDDEVDFSPHSQSIPNGGLKAWSQVFAAFLIYFNIWGFTNTFGAYQTYYEQIWPDKSSSTIAWIGSIQTFLLYSLGTITGPIFDMGYYRYLEVGGFVLLIVGIMMTSLCTEYWQAMLAQGLCVGLGTGMLYIPCATIPATYFTTKRPFTAGLASMGSSIGATIYSIVFHKLEPRVGFKMATQAIGYIALGTLAIALAILHARVKSTTPRSLKTFMAFTEPPFAVYAWSIFFFFMGMYIPFFYISSYAIEKVKLNAEMGFYMITILNAGSVLGRVIPNYIASHIGTFNVTIPSALVAMILAFVWLAIDNLGGLIVFGILFGMTSGTYVSMMSATVASISDDIRLLGGRIGLIFLSGGIGVLIGNPIAGVLIDRQDGSYWKMQLFCAILLVVATCLAFVARWLLVKNTLWVRV